MTTLSLGGNYHWSGSASESLMSLVDLNGDGLADKVFANGYSLYWCKQELPQNGIITFGAANSITGPAHFLVDNGETSTWGAQADVRFAKGSGSWSNTTSKTSTYFADVDGDGLVDLIHEGEVYFNRLNDGEPAFYRYSEPPVEETDEEPEMQRPICDSIIFDGMVDDTVVCDRVWISDPGGAYFDSLTAANFVQNFEGDENHVAVVERDSLGYYHVVHYEAIVDCSRRNLAGRHVPRTESVRVWVAPGPGTVNIDASVILAADERADRSRHSDGITYVIQHSQGVTPHIGNFLMNNLNDNIILDTIHICNSCRDELREKQLTSIPVQRGDVFFFRVQSMDDRQFDNVWDDVIITYNNMSYNSNSSFLLTDNNYFQAPANGHYSYELVDSNVNSGLNVVLFKGNCNVVSTDSITQDGILLLVVYPNNINANWDNTDVRAKIQFWNSGTYADTITFWTVGTKKVLHPEGSIWGDTTYQSLFGPLYNGWGQFTYNPLIPSLQQILLPFLFVPSQFKTDNLSQQEQDSLDDILNNTHLTGDDFNTPSIEDFENSQQNGGLYNVLSDTHFWIPMNADALHNRWVAFGGHNSIGRDTMSNCMQKEWYDGSTAVAANHGVNLPPTPYFDDAVPPASTDGTPAKAVLKVNESKNNSYTGSASIYNASYSNGSSNIETDYIDLNGDRYPDIVGTGFIQYRQQWGGLGSRKGMPYGINDVTMSVTNSAGVGFGASPVSHKRTVSAKPSDAKFTIEGDGSSVSLDLNIGWNHSSSTWTDVNGDGLPDYVTNEGKVRLNTGYTFLGNEDWNFSSDHAIHSGMSASGSGGANTSITNLSQGSIQLGGGLSRSVNRTDHTLMDINGDGLPDLIWRNVLDFRQIDSLSDLSDPLDSIHVKFNLGNGRWSQQYNLNIKNFNWSEAYNESLNLGGTFGFTFLAFKATLGLNGTPYSSGTNRDRMQLVDVNGDGLPDLVTSDSEDIMTVRYNMAGKTNLLCKVTNITGSEIHLSYHLSTPDYMQPSRTWLLDTVTTYDPLNPNGGDTSVTVFEYSNPNYNRFERTFFGYGTVVTKQIEPTNGSVYRKVTRNYLNTNILNKGRIKRDLTSDGNDNYYIEKEYFYNYASYNGGEVDTCTGNAYSIGDRVVTRFYEGAPFPTLPKLTTAETRQYDSYHNVLTYIDEGDTAYNDDGLTVDFTYYTSQPHNLIGLRQDYKVYPTGSSSPQRQAQFLYNNQGKLTKQTLGSGPDTAVYDFYYDSIYGNMIQAHLPKNDSNQRMIYDYTYDPFVHTYPDSITNSHGEVTTTTYNYRLCKPVTITDPSGNTMTYDYDCLGRIIAVWSPLNNSATPSLRNFYYTYGCWGYYNYMWYNYHYLNHYDQVAYLCTQMQHTRPYSITEHYDDHGNLITRTVVITDGFGRVLQTKKGLTEDGVPSMQVSGRAIVDHFGRTTRQYDPFTVADTSLVSLGVFEPYMDSSATVTHYDVLDRATAVYQPLGVTTHNYYNIKNDAGGRRRFYTQTTDPKGNVTEQYSDYDGHQVQVTSDANGIAATTSMHYDNLGQLEYTVDPEGFTTYYGYDDFGRLIYRDHPDAGVTTYDYDPAGNLIQESNPLGQIYYDYTYYRPRHKRYSYMTGNDVEYTYGTSGNETGRLVQVVDGSGSYECFYDALGNVIEDTRTIAVPDNNDVYRFKTQYTYDSWGRMDTMVYPDGETVSYDYIWGGDLFAMDGDKNGTLQSYIRGIYYNRFGQRDSVQYGNNTRAHYTYDALHRLSHLTSFQHGGAVMQDIDYTFDSVSNIKRIKDSVLAIGTLGGGYDNTFNYDGLHRLEGSQGDNTLGHYRYTMDYTPSGRITNKYLETPSSSLTGSVNMFYGYCNDLKPHAVRRMYDDKNGKHFDLRWDGAGNLGQISIGNEDAKFETGRFLFWTEDNRMHAAVDEKYSSYYAYDHSGERRLKLTGMNDLMDVNADYMYTASIMKEPTLYPSAYMVMSNKGYTKHYYAGTERVAARIGGGGLNVIYSDQKLSDSASVVFHQSLKQINDRHLENNDIDCIANGLYSNDKLLIDLNEVPEHMKAKLRIDYSEFRHMIADAQSIHHNEPDVYFYHSDHLGSASWITDNGGLAVQHLQYLPYGERYVDQRAAGYHERFTFTGKERDEETGYGYFGARYMDHELMTMWLSVDPMADKYPSMTPYSYCAWNPMKLVDPDGREIDDYFSESGKYLGSDNATTNNVRIIGEYAWKNLPKDDKGRIEHELGNIVSKSFSEASEGGLSKKAQINIYNYYNPTKYSISAKAKESEDTKTGGMATVVGYENKKTTIRIEIYLKGNINTKTCDNADEIINSFIHEKNHIEKAEQVGYHNYVEMRKSNRYELESSAVAAQKSHPSWNGTSKVYKERVNNYLESFKKK